MRIVCTMHPAVAREDVGPPSPASAGPRCATGSAAAAHSAYAAQARVPANAADDLAECAHVALRATRREECLAVDHRTFAPTGAPANAACEAEVRASDVLVVLGTHRYGGVPTTDEGGDDLTTMGAWEVRTAAEAGVPVLALLVNEDHPRLPKMGEYKRAAGLARLRQTLQSGLRPTLTDAASVEAPGLHAIDELAPKLGSRTETSVVAEDPASRHRRAPSARTAHIELIGFGDNLLVKLPIAGAWISLRVTVPRSFEPHRGGGLRSEAPPPSGRRQGR